MLQKSQKEKLYEVAMLAIRVLYFSLLALYAIICVLAAVRFRYFNSAGVSFWIFILLGITVYATIHVLRSLRSYNSEPVSSIENIFIYAPASILGLFVVLPSLNLVGIVVYVLIFVDSFYRTRILDFSIFKHKIVQSAAHPQSDESDEDEEIEHESDGNAFFRLVRSQSPNGDQRLEAWIKVNFVANEKVVNVHVPFCPTFANLPEIEQYQLSGDEIDLEISQLTPLGIRLDVKRPAKRNGEETVEICVFATVS